MPPWLKYLALLYGAGAGACFYQARLVLDLSTMSDLSAWYAALPLAAAALYVPAGVLTLRAICARKGGCPAPGARTSAQRSP